METQTIEQLLQKLKDKSSTHPNFSKLWHTYILYKYTSFKKEVKTLDEILNNLNDSDLDVHDFSYIINNL